MKPSHNIDSLQALRAFAAILVLFFHLGDFFYANFPQISIFKYCVFGNTGVDLFFVLSGFIIYFTSIKKSNTLSAEEFLIKRAARIFPMYWLAWLMTLFLYMIGKKFFHLSSSNSTIIWTIEQGGISSLLKSFLLIPNDFRTLFLSWTLSFEIIFYLFFGFLFFRNRSVFLIGLFAWTLICYINAFYVHIDYEIYLSENPARSLLNPVVSEFFWGCCAAILVVKIKPKYPMLIAFIGFIIFLISSALEHSFETHAQAVFYLGGSGLLIVYGMAHIKSAIPAILIYLGDASYSIYLFHYTIFSIYTKLLKTLHSSFLILTMFVFSFVLIIAICCLIHHFIEKPVLLFCHKIIDGYFRKNKASVIPAQAY